MPPDKEIWFLEGCWGFFILGGGGEGNVCFGDFLPKSRVWLSKENKLLKYNCFSFGPAAMIY